MAFSKLSSRKCEFVSEFVEQTSKDLDCPICFQVLWNPFLTACCGNHLCEVCVKATKEKSNQCPFCNEEPISGIIDKKLQRKINELQVYCLHKKHGCLWVGELGKLAKHLEEDKTDGECKFVLLSCSLSCGKQIIRCELEEHLAEECPRRAYKCEYCGFSSTYEDVTTKHYSDCPSYPVVCPNSCSEEKLKRSGLDRHLLDCPDEVVSCSFNEMGCEERIKRRCLQEHIEANVIQHQLMICNAFKNVKKENESLKDAFKNVKKENESLKDDIKILKQSNEELQKNDATLKSAQGRMDHSTIGFVLKVDEEVPKHQWKEYFSSLALVSTNTPNPVCPVIIKWPDYSGVKQVAKDAKSSSRLAKCYFTRPFYTHHNGYKMQLRVYPYGENNSISIYCHLMQGENDDHLKWPYNGTVVITLLNQLEDGHHVTRSLSLGYSAEHVKTVKKPEFNAIRNVTGRGYPKFISLSEVESSTVHTQYLMNDTLYLKISSFQFMMS